MLKHSAFPSPGDVVLLRSAPSPTKGNARIDPSEANDKRAEANKGISSVSEVSEVDLWYGLVKYFYDEDDDEEADLQVHVVW